MDLNGFRLGAIAVSAATVFGVADTAIAREAWSQWKTKPLHTRRANDSDLRAAGWRENRPFGQKSDAVMEAHAARIRGQNSNMERPFRVRYVIRNGQILFQTQERLR